MKLNRLYTYVGLIRNNLASTLTLVENNRTMREALSDEERAFIIRAKHTLRPRHKIIREIDGMMMLMEDMWTHAAVVAEHEGLRAALAVSDDRELLDSLETLRACFAKLHEYDREVAELVEAEVAEAERRIPFISEGETDGE